MRTQMRLVAPLRCTLCKALCICIDGSDATFQQRIGTHRLIDAMDGRHAALGRVGGTPASER
ncbi:hypothetical protein XHC_2016 [Xanthomonas hortorum pv. carotae str. M081]|nr:hypothetical protein XHC_2016 [Xanthomonas hortorum pv. carotae str. M081]